jgi:hypothetical protein
VKHDREYVLRETWQGRMEYVPRGTKIFAKMLENLLQNERICAILWYIV